MNIINKKKVRYIINNKFNIITFVIIIINIIIHVIKLIIEILEF